VTVLENQGENKGQRGVTSLLISNPDEVIASILDFIRSYLKESGCKQAIVGLSGGVDSSLTALLLTRALGAERIIGLLLPESKEDPDVKDALKLANKLGIEHLLIPIGGVIKAFEELFSEKVPYYRNQRKALGNVKARTRMIVDYLLANLTEGLVVGSSNRTELLLGYYTKYGDGGADVLPLGDLFKTQVWQLAKHLGLPKEIIEKTPAAGLWEGQTDEEELGECYELIDQILYHLINKCMTPEQVSHELGVKKTLVQRFAAMIESSKHKRIQPPTPGLAL
jgi:NAD+ synthase